MKTKYKFIVLLSVLFLFGGCTHNFEEINTNPNNPDRIDQPRLLLSGVIRRLDNLGDIKYYGGVLGDYWVDQFVSMFNDSFNNTQTGQLYYDGRDVQDMIELAEKYNMPYIQGMGLIIKSFMFQQMTDTYGDFPYFEALKGKTEDIFTPKYDSQEDIYNDLLVQLEKANELLSNSSPEEIGAYDCLYNGDALKWRKFANSLKLRLLMRMSGKKDVSKNISDLLSQPDKYPLMTSINDNAVLSFLNDESAHWSPLYGSNLEKYNGTEFMSVVIEDHLKAMNDSRMKVYFCPTVKGVESGKYIYAGVPNCVRDADEAAFNGGDSYNSRKGYLFAPRQLDEKYASPTAAQSILLTYSEVMFNLAEAREKGLITTGDAATYYKNGIAASFDYWASRIPANFKEMKSLPFPPTEIFEASDVIPDAGYYEQPKVAYTGTQAEKLEKIGVQKWISLFLCGIEGWSEWRRTGFPKEISITPPKGLPSSSNIKEWPRRVPYPQNEVVYNTDQYNAAVAKQGADDLLTRMWWNK